MRDPRDTICACATPPGEGGVAVVRISGPEALPAARALFCPTGPQWPPRSHTLRHGWLCDPQTGEPLDEVLFTFMAAPGSFTGEDVVEFHCHGSPAVVARVLSLLVSAGARPAEPGEFTRRAFLSGRLDLSQAEAVCDLIAARSEAAAAAAARSLAGGLRREAESLREALLSVEAAVLAAVDFEEDAEGDAPAWAEAAENLARAVISPLSALLLRGEAARPLREGLALAIAGRPNAGKSSILNALTGRDRAIVTDVPGTTRDVIEDAFELSGVAVRILDTAGIRAEPDAIEALGIERARRAIAESDAVLWVIDGSRPLSPEDDLIHGALAGKPRVVVLNKRDLPAVATPNDVRRRYGEGAGIISLCALDAADVARLREHLSARFLAPAREALKSAALPNAREREALARALSSARRAEEILRSGGYLELAGVELSAARQGIEAVLGIGAGEDLLDRVFSRFCVGK